jgi:hypothetical protein
LAKNNNEDADAESFPNISMARYSDLEKGSAAVAEIKLRYFMPKAVL